MPDSLTVLMPPPSLSLRQFLNFFSRDGEFQVQASQSTTSLRWILPRAKGKMLVREVYQLIEARIRDRLERQPYSGAVIVGNPGSGKSTFIHYILHRELADKRTVILNKSQETHVFTANRVFLLKKDVPNTFFEDESYAGVLALLESPQQVVEPPMKLVSARVSCFPVLATSPTVGRYKYWSRKRMAARLVMNPFTAEESERLVNLYATPSQFHENRLVIASIFKNFGPDFRHQLDFLSEGQAYIDRHDRAIRTAIDNLTFEQARQLTTGSSDSRLVSYTLIRTFRSTKGYMQHQVISGSILKRLLHRLTMYNLSERQHLCYLFHTSTCLSVSLGRMFEHLTHELLAKGMQLSLQPYSPFNAHGKLVIDLFPLEERTVSSYPKNTKFSETTEEECYYIPLEGNNPTFDSFVIIRSKDETIGIAFRMTVGRTHTVNNSGLKVLLDRFNEAKVTRRIFVFVAPPGRVLKIETPTAHYKKQFEWRHLEVDFSQEHHHLALEFALYRDDMEEGVMKEKEEDGDNDDLNVEMELE